MYYKYGLATKPSNEYPMVCSKTCLKYILFQWYTNLLLQVAQPGSVPMVVNTTRPRTDYMVPAVLSCLCCFCPTGIFAILAASRVMSFTFAYNIILSYTFACLKHYIVLYIWWIFEFIHFGTCTLQLKRNILVWQHTVTVSKMLLRNICVLRDCSYSNEIQIWNKANILRQEYIPYCIFYWT